MASVRPFANNHRPHGPPVSGEYARRLQPLLAPRSIALIGASPTPRSFASDLSHAIRRGGFPGQFFPVNPKHRSIDDEVCYPSIAELPEAPDLAILSVSNAQIEAALEAAIEKGARSVLVFASCYEEPPGNPPLLERLRAMAHEAGIPACGGNCLGFYNFEDNVHACAYGPNGLRGGEISLIAHSGSVFGALVHSGRLTFNLAVSSGQELTTTTADYMHYALDRATTRAIGLFVETIRDPENFVAALRRAEEQAVPVVALKVGRTPESARHALSHTGALAGSAEAFGALLDRHGAISVRTLDELASTLMLLSHPRAKGPPGGLAAIHDSGGERELAIDLAADLGVCYAPIGEATKERLARRLAPGLEPDNPLDAFGTGNDFIGDFAECLAALMDDPGTGLGLFFADLRTGSGIAEGYAEACRRAALTTNKLVAMATNYTALSNVEIAAALHRDGIPVLDGTEAALLSASHLLAWREHRAREDRPAIQDATARKAFWRARLLQGTPLLESEGLALLSEYAVAVPNSRSVSSLDEALSAARALGFPIVAKTAEGHLHKSDSGGVVLDLRDETALSKAYTSLAHRLGPRVLLAQMAPPGIELAFGGFVDPQFGPIVTIGAGGTLIELFGDRRFALAPIGLDEALRMISALKSKRLLDGYRGAPAADRMRLAEAFSRFSVLVADFADVLTEVDVNPVRVSGSQSIALDALFVGQSPNRSPE